jgi:hypothetical protein
MTIVDPSGLRSQALGAALVTATKCSFALWVWNEELATGLIGAEASAAFLAGGEVVPGVNVVLATPTAPSTIFLPTNFPP